MRAGVFRTRTWRTGSVRGVASVNERRLASDHHLVAASYRVSSPRVHRTRQSERVNRITSALLEAIERLANFTVGRRRYPEHRTREAEVAGAVLSCSG
jgi:hypothetical protein